MRFLIVGGDLRQIHLAKILENKGHDVKMLAFEKIENLKGKIGYEDLKKGDYEVILLPLPLNNAENRLYAPFSKREIDIGTLIEDLPSNAIIFYGKAKKEAKEQMKERKLIAHDIYKREEFVELNGILTAEGAIEFLLREMKEALFESKILILGNGRISKALADRLKGFACDITISARKARDFAQIRGRGFKHIHTNDIKSFNYDVIINTIPAKVINNQSLCKIRKSTKILELASPPYGFEMKEAKVLGLDASLQSGLPSKTAAKTAGKIIYETVFNIMEEENYL